MDQRQVWEQRYATDEYVFGEEPNAFLKSCAPYLRPGMRTLALADGEARNGVWLAEQGLDVLSTDISPRAQEKAGLLARRREVKLELAVVDLAEWNWPVEEFDLIVAIFIQFAGPELRCLIFSKVKRALKDGGLLLMEGYRPEQLQYGTGGPPLEENMYTSTMVRDAFSDFEILSLVSYDAEIHEGTGHSGKSALIDLVARKPKEIS